MCVEREREKETKGHEKVSQLLFHLLQKFSRKLDAKKGALAIFKGALYHSLTGLRLKECGVN